MGKLETRRFQLVAGGGVKGKGLFFFGKNTRMVNDTLILRYF